MNRVGLNYQPIAGLKQNKIGFGSENGEKPVHKIAEMSKTVEDNVLEPAAAVAIVGVGAAAGGKGGSMLTKRIERGIAFVAEGLAKVTVPTVKFLSKNPEGMIGKQIHKLPELINTVAHPEAVAKVAAHISTPAKALLTAFTALSGAVIAGKHAEKIEDAASQLVNPEAVLTVMN